MLLNETALRKRIAGTLYDHLRTRAKPRRWKSGKRAGAVRVQGIEALPFTREQLWQHALAQVGTGVIRCPYCETIGRPANLIDLTNCVFDHKVPTALGGSHALDNLFAICADCNNLKGKLSYAFFVGLMAAIERWPDETDRKNIHACLRTHGTVMRLKFDKKKPGAAALEGLTPTTGVLALAEEF